MIELIVDISIYLLLIEILCFNFDTDIYLCLYFFM